VFGFIKNRPQIPKSAHSIVVEIIEAT